MGKVKRKVYNEALMGAIDYSKPAGVKAAIKRLLALEGLAAKGDTVAASIMMDVKGVLGLYDNCLLDLLTGRQREVIVAVLVQGEKQSDVAADLNINQSSVCRALTGGIERIHKHLGDAVS